MVRKSLLVFTLLAVAAPLAAQEEVVWSSKRPDASAPFGIPTAQMLEPGKFQFTYRLHQASSKGVWYQADSLSYDETLSLYPIVPLSLQNLTHEATLAYAPTERLTVMATMGFSRRHREQVIGDSLLYFTNAHEFGDLEVSALYSVFQEGTYRAHVQLGAIVPTGTTDVRSRTPGSGVPVALSYDMRPGSGVFAAVPGMTFAVQNDVATVGAQMQGVVRFSRNSLGYRPGNRFEASAWAAYMLNEYLAVTARGHYEKWGAMRGADPNLNPTLDPGNEYFWGGGRRIEMPVGLNLQMPEGGRFAGHRLSLEWIFPVSQHYNWLQLGSDWGLVAGWQMSF